jgi:dephospho-CoA kinase
MKTIGLTGGIGSGKSTVGAMLKDMGAAFIDADKVGHRLLREDAVLKRELVSIFGEGIINGDGQINRRRLASIVFANREALHRLNAATHPRINRAIAAETAACRKAGFPAVVIEAPLLIEAGWAGETDFIWLTEAPPAVVLRRLVEGMGYTSAEASARISAQISNEERRRYATAVIDTDVPLPELRHRVETLWREITD